MSLQVKTTVYSLTFINHTFKEKYWFNFISRCQTCVCDIDQDSQVNGHTIETGSLPWLFNRKRVRQADCNILENN